MKPCAKYRERITWLALDNLDQEQAVTLRRHVESCEGCRHYLQELTTLTSAVAEAPWQPNIQTTPAFHRKLVTRIKGTERNTVRETIRSFLWYPLPNWQVALPTVAGVALLLGVGLLFMRSPAPLVPSLPNHTVATHTVATAPNIPTRLLPTIANYQMVASRSLDQLDQLLSDQGSRNLTPAPVFTASTQETGPKD